MKMFDNPLIRYRLGTALIWLGVLTWAPFILLRIAGEKPSLFLYLAFHLAGVKTLSLSSEYLGQKGNLLIP